ncbi:DUF3221 domain-containing protein [Paenibacillus taiwanensis]|uniref:DUF3221 domain-containing protein n=1 Tax=Paenibacillus taiwanensis TaxID=401638 RepID=UPI0004102092|nr:DUF3221 domain-containing protein [Paenibacillus taiwanensis]
MKNVEENEYTMVGYVVKNTTTSILIVSIAPSHNKQYEALWLTTKEKIDIGKKAEVTLEEEIHTSFPGQGTAKQLKVLQMESPDTARLPAEAALKTALLQVNEWEIPAVKEIIYQNMDNYDFRC